MQPVTNYGLYITEEDGEVDRDFPCLDAKEVVAKFGFTCLGLVEHKNTKTVCFDNVQTSSHNESIEDNVYKAMANGMLSTYFIVITVLPGKLFIIQNL